MVLKLIFKETLEKMMFFKFSMKLLWMKMESGIQMAKLSTPICQYKIENCRCIIMELMNFLDTLMLTIVSLHFQMGFFVNTEDFQSQRQTFPETALPS